MSHLAASTTVVFSLSFNILQLTTRPVEDLSFALQRSSNEMDGGILYKLVLQTEQASRAEELAQPVAPEIQDSL